MLRLVLVPLALLAAPVLVVATLALGFDPIAHAGAQPLIHRDGDFTGALVCQGCHPDHHASWARTFHSTMTQRPEPQNVRGAFDGRTLTWQGRQARPRRDGDRFVMELPVAGGGSRVAEVALLVGSRRYQQYFEREPRGAGFAFRRLPLLWHIDDQQWLHVSAVFLGGEPPEAEWGHADWDTHRATWNKNCVFCHNTGPHPRHQNFAELPPEDLERYDSKVAELGISCESCHGPGRAHVTRMQEPVTRVRARLAGGDDAIVDPRDLEPSQSVSVCGQCHGQRLPKPYERVAAWLATGPTFRPGQELLAHVQPIDRDTPSVLGHDPELFRQRFWNDGTPRLTAYEYQGVLASPCHQRGPMTCLSCHVMHGGDPRGQLTAALRGNAACLQCHPAIGRDVAAHTHHAPASSGSQCVECHMPRIVYGILGQHRSHRIENPDPARDTEAGRPNACTLCHLDQSPVWAATRMAAWWGPKYRTPRSRPDQASLDLPDAIASLAAGDAVQRSIHARALGRPDRAPAARELAFARVHLIAALADAYPSVRYTAQQSLLALERELPLGMAASLTGFARDAKKSQRVTAVHALFAELAQKAPGKLAAPRGDQLLAPDFTPRLPQLVELLQRQSSRVINIGE